MKSFRTCAGFSPLATAALLALQPWSVAAAAEGEKPGLPQLDTSLFPEQLFWLAVTFGLLYLLMTYIALPGVRRTQETRRSVIETELAAAQAANEAAKAMTIQYEKALVEARAKAQETVSQITSKVMQDSAERQAAQQREIHKRLHDAEMNILAIRNKALSDIQGAASELAAAIVEKITGQKVKA